MTTNSMIIRKVRVYGMISNEKMEEVSGSEILTKVSSSSIVLVVRR